MPWNVSMSAKPPSLENKREQAAWLVDEKEEGSSLAQRILVVGDALVYIVFAATGRAYHGEDLSPQAVLETALPFTLGWYISAVFLGGYGPGATSGKLLPAVWTAFRCWLLGTPLGVGFHALSVGHRPPLPFVKVAVIVTFCLMMAWRVGFAAATPIRKDPVSEKSSATETREALTATLIDSV